MVAIVIVNDPELLARCSCRRLRTHLSSGAGGEYVSSTLILRAGEIPSSNSEWLSHVRDSSSASWRGNSAKAKPLHFVGSFFE